MGLPWWVWCLIVAASVLLAATLVFAYVAATNRFRDQDNDDTQV